MESKSLTPIPPYQAVLAQFEEPEVRPRDWETELDQHPRGGGDEDDEDVGEEEVDPR